MQVRLLFMFVAANGCHHAGLEYNTHVMHLCALAYAWVLVWLMSIERCQAIGLSSIFVNVAGTTCIGFCDLRCSFGRTGLGGHSWSLVGLSVGAPSESGVL